MIKKPMLAVNCTAPESLKFPLLATPKLDGIRCLTLPNPTGMGRCAAVSRTFKPIQNNFVRMWIEEFLPPGLDGELMVRNRTFSEGTGDLARSEGTPDFVFHVFDCVLRSLTDPYKLRMEHLREIELGKGRIEKVLPRVILSRASLDRYEAQCLEEGYEGVMIRTPDSPYKCGRSTEREGYLLKIKRFEDSEAEVIGFEEQMHNGNEATKDAFGRTKRSSHAENKTGTGKLGALVVRMGELKFNIGTGFDDAQRTRYWLDRATLVGRLAKFKHQPSGAKEAPRFPVFLGFRDPSDL